MGERSTLLNIEKKIVANSAKLSSIAKKTIAATFGMATTASFISCDGAGTEPIEPPKAPSPESSDSDSFSSSSKYLDIPQSHEAISSEILEALSSAAQPANSSATTPASSAVQPANSSAAQPSSSANAPTSAAQPLSSATQVSSSTSTPASSVEQSLSQSSEQSSSANQPESSAAAPVSSATQPTSSTETTPASSALQPASSSSSNNGWNIHPQDNPCEGVPDGTVIENGFQVIICPIPSSSSHGSSTFPGFSMVTTFEIDDAMV